MFIHFSASMHLRLSIIESWSPESSRNQGNNDAYVKVPRLHVISGVYFGA